MKSLRLHNLPGTSQHATDIANQILAQANAQNVAASVTSGEVMRLTVERDELREALNGVASVAYQLTADGNTLAARDEILRTIGAALAKVQKA